LSRSSLRKEEEKSEIERILREFEIRYEQALGELISKLMRLKMEKLEEEASNDESKKEEYEEARKTFEEHENTFEELKKQAIRDLNSDELDDLKKSYREAAKICHPDTAAEEFREKSKEAFQKLSEAYHKNDLEGVKDVLYALKHGGQLLKDSDVVSDKSILESRITSLKKKIDEIDIQLEEYENSEAWTTVNGLDDWDEFFNRSRVAIEKEIEELI
jgi:DnaJ-class molecular chaperone with C-terminal Zn finger domain